MPPQPQTAPPASPMRRGADRPGRPARAPAARITRACFPEPRGDARAVVILDDEAHAAGSARQASGSHANEDLPRVPGDLHLGAEHSTNYGRRRQHRPAATAARSPVSSTISAPELPITPSTVDQGSCMALHSACAVQRSNAACLDVRNHVEGHSAPAPAGTTIDMPRPAAQVGVLDWPVGRLSGGSSWRTSCDIIAF